MIGLVQSMPLQVESNTELNGIVVSGGSMLPSKIIEDAFRDQYGKPINFGKFQAALSAVDKWYSDRGIWTKAWSQRL